MTTNDANGFLIDGERWYSCRSCGGRSKVVEATGLCPDCTEADHYNRDLALRMREKPWRVARGD